jgi:hypothetical protein
LWRLAFTLAALAGLTLLTPQLSCSTANRLVEKVLNQTPQAETAAYLEAAARGDREAALALWLPGEQLQGRRERVTGELLAYGSGLRYRILDVEWWRTCCEPGVLEDSSGAGGARILVALSSAGRPEAIYAFDLLVPGGYWGEAAGSPVRQWAIVDVYPEEAAPLAWSWR